MGSIPFQPGFYRSMYYNFDSGEIADKEREFDAFKEHSSDLLERERHLNKRLRNYSMYPSDSNNDL